MKMLQLSTLVCAVVLTLGAPVRAESTGPSVVTVLTSAEPQTQLMAMVLTMQAIQQGARGHVLLCGPAADLALKDAPASATAPQEPKGMSPQGLMRTIMDRTATPVEVCAIYLPNKGLDASALIDGVTAAKPPAMAARLIAEDVRILSF